KKKWLLVSGQVHASWSPSAGSARRAAWCSRRGAKASAAATASRAAVAASAPVSIGAPWPSHRALRAALHSSRRRRSGRSRCAASSSAGPSASASTRSRRSTPPCYPRAAPGSGSLHGPTRSGEQGEVAPEGEQRARLGHDLERQGREGRDG